MGIAPTAVLGATYLATNTSQFLGVTIPDDDGIPILASKDQAATIKINGGILEADTHVNGTVHKWQTTVGQANGALGFSTEANGIPPTSGFSFAKNGTLVFHNETASHGFRGCHSAGSDWPTVLFWQSIHEPLEEDCSYLSLTKVEA
jgi:hypothetical protein